MALIPVILGLVIGCGILYNFASAPQPRPGSDGDSKKQQGIRRHIEALEKSSVKDFQALLKKIDDEDERKEVVKLLKQSLRPKKLEDLDILNLPLEDQMVEATDSFVKGMLRTIAELLICIVLGTALAHYCGVVNVYEYL